MVDWNNSGINGVLSGPESKDIFTSDWKDSEVGAEATIHMEFLPQRFTGPPINLGKVLEQILEQFQPPKEEFLLQNVYDRLLSGQEKTVVKEATNKLFNFLGKQGLGVLKNKLQYVEREVRYLRHLMSEGKLRINPERIQGIVEN